MDRSVSYVQKGMKSLRDAKVIEYNHQHPTTGCWSYKLKCYEPALEYLEAHPNLPKCKVKQLVPTSEQTDQYTEQAMENPHNPAVLNEDTPHPQCGDSNSSTDLRAPVLPDTGTSTSMDTDEVSEKRGDDINLEDEESPKEKDIVPTTEIGKAKEVDKLVETIMGEKQSKSRVKPP